MKTILLATLLLICASFALAGKPTVTTDTISKAPDSKLPGRGFVAQYSFDYSFTGTDTLIFPFPVQVVEVTIRNTSATDTLLVSAAQAGFTPKFTLRLMGTTGTVFETRIMDFGRPVITQLVVKSGQTIKTQVVARKPYNK